MHVKDPLHVPITDIHAMQQQDMYMTRRYVYIIMPLQHLHRCINQQSTIKSLTLIHGSESQSHTGIAKCIKKVNLDQ